MNVQTLIFSKDRPLQLHGTLESLRLRCRESAALPVSVICKASEAAYADGYDILKKEFGGRLQVEWIMETDFKKDLLAQVEDPGSAGRGLLHRLLLRRPGVRRPHVMFLVDDNLFIRDFSMQQVVRKLDATPSSIGFSLRVGKNTSYCYSNRCDQAFPRFTERGDGILEFSWPGQEGDFGYPLEVSSSVYRTVDVITLLRTLPYSNPNRLEQGLSVSSRLFARKHGRLLCFEQSVAFCAPVNKVQSILDNRAGSTDEYSSGALNRLFLDGARIDVEKLNCFVPNAAHQEIDLPLIRQS